MSELDGNNNIGAMIAGFLIGIFTMCFVALVVELVNC